MKSASHPSRALAALLFVFSLGHGQVVCGEKLSAKTKIHDAIDHFVAGKIAADKITAAKIAGDAVLIRRTTLDLAGRIPTAAEVQAYVESRNPLKRVRLVDRLSASPDFNLHQRNELDDLLLNGRKSDRKWREYLLQAVRENRSWDRMFREMIAGRQDKPQERIALTFLKVRAKSRDDMASDTSRIFFGVSISCAKCHDHPLVDSWKQDHFFGFSSFFERTYLTKSNRLGEKSTGVVKFKTTEGKEKRAQLMFLTGAVVAEPKSKRTKAELKKEAAEVRKQMKDKNAPPPKPPAFSPRRQLVELALKPKENRYLSRAIVNRIWARLTGYGFVEPLDQMHSENAASHPELLDWLARDFVSHGYDLKRLIRGIVLSRTYARSSRWQGKGDPPSAEYFAVAVPRPLTPRQYAISLSLATMNPQTLPFPPQPEKWKKRRTDLERSAAGFAAQIERPGENFQISVDEALLFSNNSRIERDYLRDSRDRLIGHLKTIKDETKMIDTAFRTVLSRAPRDEEMKMFRAYLGKRKTRRLDGIRQIVWALITSPELRFNY